MEFESTLGNLACQLYLFANEGKYSPDYLISSPVKAGEKIKAREVVAQFSRDGFLVKPAHLPLDPHVRAIQLKGGMVSLETTRVNLKDLGECLDKYGPKVTLRGCSGYIHDLEVIRTRTQNATPGIIPPDMRTITKILPNYHAPGFNEAIQVIDQLDNGNYYFQQYLPNELSQVIGSEGKLELKQRLDLHQRIEQLQTPKLLATLQQNLLLSQMIRRNQILKTSTCDLGKFISAELAANPALELVN